MNDIFFPDQYKKSLLAESKNITIRIKSEIGRYKIGETYDAKSYSGEDWGIKIKILKIIPTKAENLTIFNIPKEEIETIKKEVSIDEKIEIIEFEIL